MATSAGRTRGETHGCVLRTTSSSVPNPLPEGSPRGILLSEVPRLLVSQSIGRNRWKVAPSGANDNFFYRTRGAIIYRHDEMLPESCLCHLGLLGQKATDQDGLRPPSLCLLTWRRVSSGLLSSYKDANPIAGAPPS